MAQDRRFQVVYDQFKHMADSGDRYFRVHVGTLTEQDALDGYLDGLSTSEAKSLFIQGEITWAEAEIKKLDRERSQRARGRARSLNQYIQRLRGALPKAG